MGFFVLEVIKNIYPTPYMHTRNGICLKGVFTVSIKSSNTENAFLVDTTLRTCNLWIFNKNRKSALYEVLLG